MVEAKVIVLTEGHVPENVIYAMLASTLKLGPSVPLTIVQILRLGELASPHHGELDLLKTLALEASPLLQSLLCVRKLLPLMSLC